MTKPQLLASHLTRAGFERVGCWEIDSERRLTHQIDLPTLSGVYAFAIDGVVQYVGLASTSVRSRLGFYRKPGASQTTNIRLNEIIRGWVEQGAVVEILVAHPDDYDWKGLKVRGSEGLEAGLIADFHLPWNVRGTASAKFAKKSDGPRAAYDRVLNVITRRPGLTELEIAKALYGRDAVQQQVNADCRMLVELGTIERLGVGGRGDPYTYRVSNNPPLAVVKMRMREMFREMDQENS